MNQQYILGEDNIVKDAVKVIEEKKVRGVFVVDKEMVLKGIFTQGDLRRYILKNGKIDAPIVDAMNASPRVFYSQKEAKDYKNMVCPIVNTDGQLLDILYNSNNGIEEYFHNECLQDIPLVIMAGGLGTRLYPLTKILPKALIPIGNQTIIERIIDSFVSWGCRSVYLILNHKADMIKAYFSEKKVDYEIHYVQEEKFLGTGGGLSLLRELIDTTFVLSNCDILINADMDCVIKTHQKKQNDITFIGAYKNMNIPYGVIQADNEGIIKKLQEKPELSFLTNTGVYVIEPHILKDMPQNIFYNITDLAMDLRKQGNQIGVFPITENAWLDMGQVDEMKLMIKALEDSN